MFTQWSAMVCMLLFVSDVLAQNPIAGNQGFIVLTEANFTSSDAYAIHGPVFVGGNFIVNKASYATGEIMKTDNGSYVFPGDGAT
ncbi:MAG TPA: hypothetical protein PK037_01470, partial [Saprospiraceae bacterium]|nr:hypothetical protein [Saprospiraceae bacterium]